MAQVDFTNARMSLSVGKPAAYRYMGMRSSYNYNFTLVDASGSGVVTTCNTNVIRDEKKGYGVSYSGTFSKSGTEFYLAVRYTGSQSSQWVRIFKIDNITFASGDTFYFEIQADLVCD